MKDLTKEVAYCLLMEAKEKKSGGYIEHSIKVAQASERIAKKLGIDSNKAAAMGYIHDIGKRYGEPYNQHVVKGYEYILDLGYDEEYASICITHSYLNNDIDCVAGGFPKKDSYKYAFRKEYIKNHKITIYDKVIQLCDLCCKNEFMIMEERLIDLMLRKGVHENTLYHIEKALELKKEIEEKLQCSIYSLFPEITTRLNK